MVNAPDGIYADSATSQITGELVELDAFRGAIGSNSLLLNVDSDIDGVVKTGGLTARARFDINIIETNAANTAGNLKLADAVSWDANAAVESTQGNVRLETKNGSILDGIVELFRPGDAGTTLTYADLSADMKIAYDNGDFSLEATQFSVSPGLMRVLFPHTEFLGLSPETSATETPNIIAKNVTLIAGGSDGGVGRMSGRESLNLAADWSNLTEAQKSALATATAEDVIGVQYELYRYTGSSPLTGVDLTNEDFNEAFWQKVTIDFVTGTDRAVPQTETVKKNQTVLVQYSSDEYGLYSFNQGSVSAGISVNLTLEDFSNSSRWTKFVSDHATDDDGNPVQVFTNLTQVLHLNTVYEYIGANGVGLDLISQDYANNADIGQLR